MITVTSSLLLNTPSVAVRRNTYVPVLPNVTEVRAPFAVPNVTLDGPLTLVQLELTLLLGSPSSATVPLS